MQFHVPCFCVRKQNQGEIANETWRGKAALEDNIIQRVYEE